MHILLVEDDPLLSQYLEAALRERRLTVDHVANGGDGLAWPNKAAIDVVILDRHLPDMDGFEFIQRWRQDRNLSPIMVLSADGDWSGKVECLNAGADDYVVKPVEVDELVARARVLMRRTLVSNRTALLEVGDLKIDIERHTVEVGGHQVIVSALEYRLLELLVRRRGGVVSKSDVLDALYALGDEPNENAVEAHVSRLRRKIGPHRILSQRGMGYAIAA